MTRCLPFVTNEKASDPAIEDQQPPIFVGWRRATCAAVKLSLDTGHAGESGEFNHAAMRLARYSSSHPAVLRRRRLASLPGAFRRRLSAICRQVTPIAG